VPLLSAPCRVLSDSSSEGNLILTIDNGNPTRLLLTAVKNHGLNARDALLKDDEFYVGVMSNGKVRSPHSESKEYTP
jgi:hypothetical protein